MRLTIALSAAVLSASAADAQIAFKRYMTEGRAARAIDHAQPRGEIFVYFSGFEAAEGYTLGDLDTQDGWESFSAEVIETGVTGSDQAARLAPETIDPFDFAEAFRSLPANFGSVEIDIVIDELPEPPRAANEAAGPRGPGFPGPNATFSISDAKLEPLAAVGFSGATGEVLALTSFINPPEIVGSFTLGVPFTVRLEVLGDQRQRIYLNDKLVSDALSYPVQDGFAETPIADVLVDVDSYAMTIDNVRFRAVTPCPGDIDGDGVVGSGDLGALLAAWGACP